MSISSELERNLWAADLKHYVSGTDEVERELWDQVGGKAAPAAQPSAKLQAEWARFQATRPQPSRRETELEAKLFEQVAATGSGRGLEGDSSHFPRKDGL